LLFKHCEILFCVSSTFVNWIPASDGMTSWGQMSFHFSVSVIPAKAGIQFLTIAEIIYESS